MCQQNGKDMTQENQMQIQTALKMIDSFDWYWRMADAWLYDDAKAGMRNFVLFVNSIDNPNIRTALRNLWTLKYEETIGIISGNNINMSAKRNEYMAALAA